MPEVKYEKWLEDDNLILVQGWARNGLSYDQIAHNMGITMKTLLIWRKTYPQIDAAVKKGREVVDLEVENALLKRALGYDYVETTVENSVKDGRKEKVVTRHVSPDVGACCFWLKNRLADRWRDKPIFEGDIEILKSAKTLLQGVEDAID